MSMHLELDTYPPSPGVYLMKDVSGKILYIGKAKNLKKRLKQYFLNPQERVQVPYLLSHIVSIDTIVVSNEKEALLLENTLIKKHQPKYNLLLKDDKTFVSLMINHKHPWPTVRLVRMQAKDYSSQALFFGPYTSAFAAREMLEFLQKFFPLRQCSDEELKRRRRPCLLYAMKRCIAPCVNLCTKEEYHTFVQEVIHFLRGENTRLLQELRSAREKAAETLDFEQAAALHQTLCRIENLLKVPSHVTRVKGKSLDVLGICRKEGEIMIVQLQFREGNLVGSLHYDFPENAEESSSLLCSFILQHYLPQKEVPLKILAPLQLPETLSEILSEAHQQKISVFSSERKDKKALLTLAYKNAETLLSQRLKEKDQKEALLLNVQETLKLTRYPRRIECFDTSHLFGSHPSSAMVAFTEGVLDKKRKRLFHIRGEAAHDDYGALHQVLSRRLLKAKEENDLPDLVIVDGGKGQLSIALTVFKELDIATIDLIAISKEAGRHDKGISAEKIHLPHVSAPLILPRLSPLLFFLQKIRDEAHRAAITFHRKKREKSTLSSSLRSLPGIGPTKQKRLLAHFGSIARIRSATKEELAQVKGLHQKDIENLQKMKSAL